MSEAIHTLAEFCMAGCTSARGARFWESEGLLGAVARSDAGVRRYTAEQMERAAIIAAAQFGGFEISKIREMLEVYHTDRTVSEAIGIRLAEQTRAALRLLENLPVPAHLKMPLEYDL